MNDILSVGMTGLQVVTAVNDNGTQVQGQLDNKADQSSLSAHTNNESIHAIIDDNVTSNSKLWSSSKVNTELAGKSNSNHTHNYAAESHTHTLADITDLQSLLVDLSNADFTLSVTRKGDDFRHVKVEIVDSVGVGMFLMLVSFSGSFVGVDNQTLSFFGTAQSMQFEVEKPADDWAGWNASNECGLKLSITVRNVLNDTELDMGENDIQNIVKHLSFKITLEDLVAEMKGEPDDDDSFINVLKRRIADDIADRFDKK